MFTDASIIPLVIASNQSMYRLGYVMASITLLVMTVLVPETYLWTTNQRNSIFQLLCLWILTFVLYVLACGSYLLVQGSDPGYLLHNQTQVHLFDSESDSDLLYKGRIDDDDEQSRFLSDSKVVRLQNIKDDSITNRNEMLMRMPNDDSERGKLLKAEDNNCRDFEEKNMVESNDDRHDDLTRFNPQYQPGGLPLQSTPTFSTSLNKNRYNKIIKSPDEKIDHSMLIK